ncbi:uncharacterized protein YbjT (DUF2867 family) [Nocardioides cavernae]|uniref:Uncharacterized protein YbjT (DUF2867 family) n=1 Tax=Nocardioides cavernae TaxID=1921566 RepID=A0A7Y9KS70_9ACTN|nr:NAD(P)H-binding protein [Nocardioides cavernae]NYE36117.1 uncharacterized protein YbjT (DUF2867 family) [Nocardioides cavernae]
MTATVLVTGARAKTGAPAVRQLAAAGADVRGGSSDPGGVRVPGVTPVRFSWDKEETWAPSLDGVDAVFVVRPDRADAPDVVARFVELSHPDTRVVLLSETAQGGYGPDDWAPRVEAAVHDSGRPWTIVRPGWFMQVLTDPRFFLDDLAQGRLPFPSGDARLAWIDARDIAAVAVAALLDPAHEGLTHVVSGPESLTLAETAAVLSAGLGRPVRHDDVDVDVALTGIDGFDREITEDTYARVRRGEFAEVTDTVQQVTGAPARSLAQFVADHADVLRG